MAGIYLQRTKTRSTDQPAPMTLFKLLTKTRSTTDQPAPMTLFKLLTKTRSTTDQPAPMTLFKLLTKTRSTTDQPAPMTLFKLLTSQTGEKSLPIWNQTDVLSKQGDSHGISNNECRMRNLMKDNR